jgi:two-component system sensor histidine kinase RegB
VTLASIALGVAWTWSIVMAAVSGYAALFIWHLPVSDHAAHTTGLPSHLAGMWLALAATATVIAFFVTGLTRTLARRERELADVRQLASRHERLASLTTLAAGAAHELATPLASIAVAARELERAAGSIGDAGVCDDARLIRSQVERCRFILDQMSGRASQEWVEAPALVGVADVLTQVRDALEADRAQRLETAVPLDLQVRTVRAGLMQALLNLVRNAFDASAPDGMVRLEAVRLEHTVEFRVEDRGAGMAADVLARAGEPFFTTKAPGAGYGLGLFLARLFAERHGGTLAMSSSPGRGTTALLRIPWEEHP